MATSNTETRGWVRVRLGGSPDPEHPDRPPLTDGEVVLRADRVAVDEGELVFLCAEEIVFRLDRRYFRTMAWFVDRPTFAEWLRGRRAQHPSAHKPWSAEERAQLAKAIGTGTDWPEIAKAHGRTQSAVRRKAIRLGFVSSTESEA